MSNWQVRYLGAVNKRLPKLGGWRGQKWVKIAENCRHGGGGVKNPEKLPTSFMDGLLVRKQSRVNVFARESNMYSFA